MINDRLQRLSDYPFTRLADLLGGLAPPSGVPVLNMAVGEPQHPAPALIEDTLRAHGDLWNRYPPVNGTESFRAAVADWLGRRYGLPSGLVDPERCILPVSGTREALFMAALLAVPERKAGAVPAVCLPNPFYAPYEGAAVMAGAEPVFLDATAATGFLPDLDALAAAPGLLDRTALVYLCSPANPQGAVADMGYLRRITGLARAHDFVLALDECYSEIYDCAPPPGGLQAAEAGETPALRRDGSNRGQVPAALVDALFELEPGGVTVVDSRQGQEVGRLSEIGAADPDAGGEALAEIRDRTRSEMTNDLLAQFNAALSDRYGVSIDREAIDRYFLSEL